MTTENPAAGAQAPDAWGERLPRRLGLWSAIAVLVGTTIGSGIFRVPASVAGQLGESGPVLLAWVVGGVITLAGALTVAELAAALPRSGGIFAYIHEAFGPLPAFLFGWAELTVIRASAIGAIATIFAEYLGYFLPLGTGPEPRLFLAGLAASDVQLVAAVTILGVGLLNYTGIRGASGVMNVVTALKYAALGGLVLLAFTGGGGSGEHFRPVWGPTAGASVFTTALISILWAYDGWSNLSFVGGEVKNPTRNLPLGLALGTLSIVFIYVSVNLAYIYLVPLPEMAESRLVAATAAERIPLLGGIGASVISAVVMVSCFGSLNGSVMTGPRILFAMSERQLFFPVVARVSPRFQSPSTAIWLASGLGVVYVLLNDFQALADSFVLGTWPFYALAVGAVFVFRRTRPDLERPYRTWGYPIVPIVFLAASIILMGNALWTEPRSTGITFLIILSGLPVYAGWRRWVRRGVTPP